MCALYVESVFLSANPLCRLCVLVLLVAAGRVNLSLKATFFKCITGENILLIRCELI